jgi:uncharacterized protein (DUF2235 family)
MSKSIVFCADGTWNGPPDQTGVSAIDGCDDHGELPANSVTNVVKLFSNLPGHVTPDTLTLRNEQEKVLLDAAGNVKQVAKYMHGVGDSGNLILKALGGVFGMGVIARIVRGYTFISRNYRAGDAIHIVGFSRGAYTARALAGMIAKIGLLDPATYHPADKNEAYRLGIAAWCKSKGVALTGTGKLSVLGGHILGLVQNLIGRQLSDKSLIPNVRIRSVAVWDTVGSMGIPLYESDRRYDLFRFVDEELSSQVDNGFHAMSIDELRLDFPVTQWKPRDKVRQVWFVGAHSDVGGGYPSTESGLSDLALDWLMRQLASDAVGVTLSAPLVYSPGLTGADQAFHKPWAKPPFELAPQSPRKVHSGDIIHRSVLDRFNAGEYRPKALQDVAHNKLLDLAVED